MKRSLMLVILLMAVHRLSATELAGVWQLMDGEYLNAEGQMISYPSQKLNAIKVLSASHFSFTSMKGNVFWASASGTYKFIDGKYTETLILNSFAEKPGAVFEFDSKVENDLWYNSRWDGDTRVEYEVWKRIE